MRLALLIFLTVTLRAAVELPPQITHNMILQRGIDNRIWGRRTPNPRDNVWVQFEAGKLRRIERSRGSSPFWEVTFSKFETTGPGVLSIWEGKEDQPVGPKIILTNVLVGDVWIVALPEGLGYSKAPPSNSDRIRVFQAPTASSLIQFGPVARSAWMPFSARAPVDVLVSQIGESFQVLTPGIPIGLVVFPSETLDRSIPFTLWKQKSAPHLAALKTADRDALQEVRNEQKEIALRMVKLKHDGKVAPVPAIKTYNIIGQAFSPWLREEYPKPIQTNEWSFKGIIYPAAERN